VSTPSDHLLETVAELLVESGYEGVSVRKVATRAGVSIGAVQHHFPSKDAMLTAAMDLMSRQFQTRLEARVSPDATAEQALRTVADELLGIGPERHAADVLWTQRLARAAVDAETAARHAREWQEVEDLLTGLLWAARPAQGQEWARREAGFLLALLDGLAAALLVEPGRMPPERAQEMLQRHLEVVLGPFDDTSRAGVADIGSARTARDQPPVERDVPPDRQR
jgi:TetR/AcrR family transcriptional repressor of bet genes